MDKIASLRLGETQGVLAALYDNGIVKVASDERFDALALLVSENLPEEYGLDDVFSKTAEILEILEEDFGTEKVAEEDIDPQAIMAAMGELT